MEDVTKTKTKRSGNTKVARPSKARAIREKCKDCIYDDCSPGTWLQQVTECESTECALWKVRPVSKVQRG